MNAINRPFPDIKYAQKELSVREIVEYRLPGAGVK